MQGLERCWQPAAAPPTPAPPPGLCLAWKTRHLGLPRLFANFSDMIILGLILCDSNKHTVRKAKQRQTAGGRVSATCPSPPKATSPGCSCHLPSTSPPAAPARRRLPTGGRDGWLPSPPHAPVMTCQLAEGPLSGSACVPTAPLAHCLYELLVPHPLPGCKAQVQTEDDHGGPPAQCLPWEPP